MSYDFSRTISSHNNKEQSNEALLLDYFKMRGGLPFASHDIQSNAVMFFKKCYNKTVQPDTLNRLWRAMRQEYLTDKQNSRLYQHGLTFKDVVHKKRKGWVVENE